jgi:hypothetical protein
LEGEVDPAHLIKIDPSRFRFALGAGTFSDPSKVGETFIIDGKPYVCWADKGGLKTESHPTFHSPFLIGLDPSQPEGKIDHWRSPSPVSLQAFYENLLKEYPFGFAILGYCHLEEAQVTYLKKPPISHENINENASLYWASLPKEKQLPICFFGVVIPQTAKTRFSSAVLEKAFYNNPREAQTAPFNSHTHAAILSSPLKSFPTSTAEFAEARKKMQVTGVRHLLTSSLIREGTFIYFPISEII